MIKILPISSRADLKKFVLFKINLYRDNPYAVPALVRDELGTITPSRNPASEFCDSQCFLAYNEQGKIVGRICAIINHRANKAWNKKEGRFGFFDFIEDIEVARLLLDAVQTWIAARGMTHMHGPLGFTDMDQEGILIEGYDQLGTMATLYNYPYYSEYMEQLGFVKDVDWVEFKFNVPYPTPERIVKFARIVEQKNNLTVVRCKSAHELVSKGWGRKIFELINSAYAKLYGYSSLTDRQIEHYVKMYLPMARIELISMVADSQGKLVGFGISMPSLSRALQKSKGRMFPFGWIHLLYALKRPRVHIVDLMLIAIDPEYQNKGLTAIIMNEVIGGMQKVGAKFSESNPELESNTTMQNQWDNFERTQHKRRRAYIKNIE
ncbi:MAG: N-acetyltransferase [Mucinivorans sp.]